MKYNVFLIISVIILIICVIKGVKKGILGLIFTLISWILVLLIIHIANPIIYEIVYSKTNAVTLCSTAVEERVTELFMDSTAESQAMLANIVSLLPTEARIKVFNSIQGSQNALLSVITLELTLLIIKGIAFVITTVLAVLIVNVLGKIVSLFGKIPGIRGANKIFGFVGGMVQGLMIVWFIMFLASCFITTSFGLWIANSTMASPLLMWIYQHNLIMTLFG